MSQATEQEINAKYSNLCTKLGDAQYKIRQHEKLIESIYDQMDHLNNLLSMLKSKGTSEDSK